MTTALNDLPTHSRIGNRRSLNSIAFSQGLAATSSKPVRARQRERGASARDRDSDAAEGGVSGGSGRQDTHRRATTTTWCAVVCVRAWACV